MLSIYTSYKCKTCSKEFFLLSEDIMAMALDKYLGCPYCNSKRVAIEKTTDSVKDCMSEHTYKRCSGRVQQKR